MSYRIINGQAYSVGKIGPISSAQPNIPIKPVNNNQTSFKDILNNVNKNNN